MKRFIEMSIALLLLILCIIPFIIIAILIKIESKGPVIYWSKRIGKNELFFWMPKFRSMKLQTPEVATDILDSKKYLTNIGNLIRKLSIDELPQIFSVFVGDMSFVGPRPALFNQYELIALRRNNSIDKIEPGITGWAQINGRDDITILEKVKLEKYYLENKSLYMDIKIVTLTLVYVIIKKNISH
tara:strand:+ start:353 stop:910 length:558 start_codon:yes stop_codon:yes gene_type:complete